MKKLTALLLATSLSMTLFGCNNKDKGTQEKGKDTMVSVWLVTSETEYEADGSNGGYQRTYTYNEKGMPLTDAYDNGPTTKVYNSDFDIYEYVNLPFDGKVNMLYQYHYNEQGDLLYYDEIRKNYDAEGNEIEGSSYNQSYGKDQYVYHYNDEGRIESVDTYGVKIGGGVTDEKYGIYHYCYDDDGNLFEVYFENLQQGTKSWAYDFRYNEDGKLTCSTYRPREAMFFYEYDYSDDGKLTAVRQYAKVPSTSPLDDQHIIQSDYAPPLEEKSDPRAAVRYTYNDEGRLISRKGVNDAKCTYDDNGRLKTVTYADDKRYVYIDKEEDATGDDTYLLRDKNGNVVKVIHPSGRYIVYTYQKFRLSKVDAARCNAVKHANAQVDIVGESVSYWLKYKGSLGFIPYLPVPENELLFTDALRN